MSDECDDSWSAQLDRLSAENPEAATFLGWFAPLAAHADHAEQLLTSAPDEPCDVIRIRRSSVSRGTVTG